MIKVQEFTEELIKNDLGPLIEVPCSYLVHFLNYLWESKRISIINPVNEAIAMGIAAGEYLGGGKIPIVAIQNSGFMNTFNALTSLHQIYNIPVFMMVTWRGEGGVGADAPEHDITGRDLLTYMQTFNLPYEILSDSSYKKQIRKLKKIAVKTKKPVVLIVKKGTFENYKQKFINDRKQLEMDRITAIKVIKEIALTKAIFISGTAYPSRDSFSVFDSPDFYIMGSMGHALAIGLGMSRHTKKKIVVFDGDGGALMHVGGLGSFDKYIHKNLIYIVLNNFAYESTGGQPAVSDNIDFKKLAVAFGFDKAYSISEKSELKKVVNKALKEKKSFFISVKIKMNSGLESKRVSDKYTAPEITARFMKKLKD